MIRQGLFSIQDGTVWQTCEDMEDDCIAGRWLIDDIQTDSRELVDVVDRIVGWFARTQAECYELTGNAWNATFDARGLVLENLYVEHIGERVLSHSDALKIIAQYWSALLRLGMFTSLEREVEAFAVSRGRLPLIPWELRGPLEFGC